MQRWRDPPPPACFASATPLPTQDRRSMPKEAPDSPCSRPSGHRWPGRGTRAPSNARCARAVADAVWAGQRAPRLSPDKHARLARWWRSGDRPSPKAGLGWPSQTRPSGHWQCSASAVAEGCAGDAARKSGAGCHEGGEGVVRVAVHVLAAVVAHHGARVGVAGGDSDIAQVGACVDLGGLALARIARDYSCSLADLRRL